MSEVYIQKVEKNGYKKRFEIELNPPPTLPSSLRWAEKWEPFGSAMSVLANDAELSKVLGRGVMWAKVEQAISALHSRFPSFAKAIAAAKQAVELCVSLGLNKEKCVAIVANATGLSKSALTGGGAGGGGGAAAGGGAGGGGETGGGGKKTTGA
jgi:uncharacterized membrane protein YgcG